MKDNHLTHCVWTILDDEEAILEPIKTGIVDRGILFEISEDGDDGTYPRVSDYKRFVNSLDREGTSFFLNRLTNKKNKLELDFCGIKIKRKSQYEDDVEIEFPNPIRVKLASIGPREIIENVSKIRGRFTHDYFWTKNGRQKEVANGFEIWFEVKEYVE
jgi:hypothetical protein